jgi:hypothetical protein
MSTKIFKLFPVACAVFAENVERRDIMCALIRRIITSLDRLNMEDDVETLAQHMKWVSAELQFTIDDAIDLINVILAFKRGVTGETCDNDNDIVNDRDTQESRTESCHDPVTRILNGIESLGDYVAKQSEKTRWLIASCCTMIVANLILLNYTHLRCYG